MRGFCATSRGYGSKAFDSRRTLVVPVRHPLMGFAPPSCKFCYGSGVVPFRHVYRLCYCVLRAVCRTTLTTVSRLRMRPWYSTEWSVVSAETSFLMVNYCCDVDITLRTILSSYEIDVLTRQGLEREQYHDRYRAEEFVGAELLSRGLYPISDYLHRGEPMCKFLHPPEAFPMAAKLLWRARRSRQWRNRRDALVAARQPILDLVAS